jgi:hypothetical protein
MRLLQIYMNFGILIEFLDFMKKENWRKNLTGRWAETGPQATGNRPHGQPWLGLANWVGPAFVVVRWGRGGEEPSQDAGAARWTRLGLAASGVHQARTATAGILPAEAVAPRGLSDGWGTVKSDKWRVDRWQWISSSRGWTGVCESTLRATMVTD